MNETKWIEMMEQDTPNDRKSLYWDGEAMTVIDDELDDNTLLDGRGGEYMVSRIVTPFGRIYSIDSENLLSEEVILQNDEDGFLSETEHRYVFVCRLPQAFADLKAQFESDAAEKKILPITLSLKKEGLCAKSMVTTPGGRTMAGLIVITENEDGTATVYQYAGLGNFSDIEVEAKEFARKSVR